MGLWALLLRLTSSNLQQQASMCAWTEWDMPFDQLFIGESWCSDGAVMYQGFSEYKLVSLGVCLHV
jgi:hypothetical protein